MTWDEFNTAVRVHTVTHNRRQGVQDMIDSLIKSGAWDLQDTIPFYADAVTRTVTPGDLTASGDYAATGTLSPGSRVLSVYAVDPEDSNGKASFEILTMPKDFVRLQSGLEAGSRHLFYYDSKTGAFYVTPSPIEDESNLEISFTAAKIDFEDDDDVPFDHRAAEAVGYMINSRMSLNVDKDPQTAAYYEKLYVQTKRKLFSHLNPALLTPPSPPTPVA